MMFIDFHFHSTRGQQSVEKQSDRVRKKVSNEKSVMINVTVLSLHFTGVENCKKNRKKEIFLFFHYKINEQQFFVALALREKLTMNNK